MSSAATSTRVHDPSSIVQCGSNYWFFATGVGIVSRHSKDLIHWTEGPRVFSSPPSWTTNTVPGNRGHFWAPDLIRLTNGYFLYYSVSTFGKNHSAIGLATNPTLHPDDPNYAWSDHGPVVQTRAADDHNAIDPAVILDRDGRLWMTYGSFWSGIKLVELDRNSGMRIASDSPVRSLAWNKSIEAPFLHRRGDDYYLFVNWGLCCRGTNSTYEIRVGRSANIAGPYRDREGKEMLKGGGTFFLGSSGARIGPGHASIVEREGKQYVSFHFYDAERNGRPNQQLLPLKWTADGWPEADTPTR